MTGGRGSSCSGVVLLLLDRRENLVFEVERLLQLDLRAEFDGQQFDRFRVERGVDARGNDIDAEVHQFAEHLRGAHADRLGKATDGGGQLERHFAFAGRGRAAGAGALDPKAAAAVVTTGSSSSPMLCAWCRCVCGRAAGLRGRRGR